MSANAPICSTDESPGDPCTTTYDWYLSTKGDTLRICNSRTPSSSSDTGYKGEIRWDDAYIYVCTETNTWKRAELTSWLSSSNTLRILSNTTSIGTATTTFATIPIKTNSVYSIKLKLVGYITSGTNVNNSAYFKQVWRFTNTGGVVTDNGASESITQSLTGIAVSPTATISGTNVLIACNGGNVGSNYKWQAVIDLVSV